jgi:hypothetical protein
MSHHPDPDSLWQEQRGCLAALVAAGLLLVLAGGLLLWFMGGF